MDKNKPLCTGLLLYTIKNIFKPSINNLIDSSNIEELIRISIFPPNIRTHKKNVDALVNINVDQAVEEFIAFVKKLPKQDEFEWRSGSFVITPTGIFIHNCRLSLSLMGRPAFEPLKKYLNEKNPRVREVVKHALSEIGLKDEFILKKLIDLLNDKDKNISQTVGTILREIRKWTKDKKQKDWINNELSKSKRGDDHEKV